MKKKKFEKVEFWREQPDCFIIPSIDYSLICAQFAEIVLAANGYYLSDDIYLCSKSKLVLVTETIKDESSVEVKDRIMLFLPIEIISKYLSEKG
ncbi:hypothetical protein [uncultured Maribacter sp.]|uniref:hypothetical protein n=1 Tax=uncultured Maribacter sp. TaxID=431308 RepID=UPI0030D864CE